MTISVDVTVLCEDLQMFYFIKHFLRQNGWESKNFKANFKPKFIPEGSGEAFVRKNYPNELKALRSVRHRKKAFLIVGIDADIFTGEDREKQLDDACVSQGIPCCQEGEEVFHIVPKRNIETWFAYLRGENFDEDSNKKYNKYRCESECDPDILELTKMCNSGQMRLPAPASLRQACEAYAKLKQFKQQLDR